ncbi:MAG: XdhC family protein [Bacteroidota bacterium]
MTLISCHDMMHEFKKIVQAHRDAEQKNITTVLATVVALNGSSYRRPGVSMLIRTDGRIIGAVSGGCVEKEVLHQAQEVFETNCPKIMIYDGRYRLGCEGTLYILIEPFLPGNAFWEGFDRILAQRSSCQLVSHYDLRAGSTPAYGTFLKWGNQEWPLFENRVGDPWLGPKVFEYTLYPCFKLWIIGAEHDAVQLCTQASLVGWEVTILASPAEEKSVAHFSGARDFYSREPEQLPLDEIDDQTAVVVMTHSYAKDLKYLLALKQSRPAYLGLLGPKDRKEKLLTELLERDLDVPEQFLSCIHGPTGLDIGAETPQEIAVAVLAEILAVTRNRNPQKLSIKQGTIHS